MEERMERAGFASRILAVILDAIVLSTIAAFLMVVLEVFKWDLHVYTLRGTEQTLKVTLGKLIIFGAGILYVLSEGFLAATAGKWLMGIKIAREDGERASVVRLLFRCFFKNPALFLIMLAFPIALAGIEGYLSLKSPLLTLSMSLMAAGAFGEMVARLGCLFIFSESGRALHDILSGTCVVYATPDKPLQPSKDPRLIW